MRAAWKLAASIALLVVVAGCSSSDAPAQSTPTNSGVVPQEKIERCAGVTAADLAPILGAAASAIKAATELTHSTLRICGYTVASGGGASFSLSWEPTVEEARLAFAQERENLAMANQAIASASKSKPDDAPYVDVLGLGDDAFWTPVNGTTVARVGNVRAQIITPSDRKAQIAIAQFVVKGLR